MKEQRLTPIVGLLVGVMLLATGLLLSTSARAEQEQQERRLQRDAEQVSDSFAAYLERARSLDLVLARDRAFVPSGAGVLDLNVASRSLAYLEVLYANNIGEACIIDQNGQERARVTNGVPATPSELSPDEAQNPFFAPTLDLPAGEVYQAPPYVSPDTGDWVISNSTWIRQPDGSRQIVHFEVTFESFLAYLAPSASEGHVAVVSGDDGQVLLQDDTPLPENNPPGEFPVTSWSRELAGLDEAGMTSVDGHPAAYERIDRAAGNANDWYVVEWTTARAGLLPVGVSLAMTGLGAALIVISVLVLRRQQATLRRAARLDHLTGLANRQALEEALDLALADANSGGDPVAILMLDLDGFKQVNDTLGHDRGDVVLQEIARRLYANVFEYDTTARTGGDEFAIVLRHLRNTEDVEAVAHRLREALCRPIDLDGVPRLIGCSIGAAVHPDHGTTTDELLRGADAAMYRAKRDREGVRVYDAGTLAGVSALGLAAELLTAIDDEQLELVFQPELSLRTGEIVGVEALARWTRPQGPVPPMEFIPLAEETGLIRSLTSLTLRRALDEVALWRRRGVRVPVSVNLSARVVTDRSLPAEVWSLLAERDLDPGALVLEVTETAVISDRTSAVEVLGQLRDGGVRIELDDFGSGYASFGALHDLPLDGVKLDRTLVVGETDTDSRLLAATVDNAQRLGLVVVAEGIEDAETLDRVRRIGCDTAQGYHLGRPMAAAAVRVRLGCRETSVSQP